jgi:hypothetical protein
MSITVMRLDALQIKMLFLNNIKYCQLEAFIHQYAMYCELNQTNYEY